MADDDVSAAQGERYELVEASCHHLIPRPPGWGDNAGVAVGSLFGLQAKMDELAVLMGTPFYKVQQYDGVPLRAPVVLCSACEAEVRIALRLPRRPPTTQA